MTIKEDFDNGPWTDFGVVVTRTIVTTTTGLKGQKDYSGMATEDITVVFISPKKKYGLDKPGLTELCDATIFIKSDQDMSKNDKIFFNEKTYRVGSIDERADKGVTVFKKVTLFLI